MMRSLFSGISGLRNHQTRMDVIGNNVSNVNTTGFKASRTIFQDIFSQTLAGGMANTVGEGGTGGTNPIQVGLGIRLSTIDVMHTGAPFGRTDNPFDMMIENEGFFIVEGPEGLLFTRVGNFGLDDQGFLVNSDGMLVLGRVRELAYVPPRPGPGEAGAVQTDNVTVLRSLIRNAILEHGIPTGLADGHPLFGLEPTDLTGINNALAAITGDGAPGELQALLNEILPADAQFPNDDIREHWLPAANSSATPLDWVAADLQPIRLRVPEAGTDRFTDLMGFNVSDNGTISVIIDNLRVDIAQLNLAMFSNNNGLERAGNSLWRQTASSGEAVITLAMQDGAGTVRGGGLEMSNVDLANEFTDMIITQRGYQANSRIITVSDSLLEELVNLKR